MKTLTLFILISFAIFTTQAYAKDFSYFITDDGHVFQDTTNGTRVIRTEKIEEAKQAKDCRPAEQDIEGNWGSMTFGCQASLRSEKTRYVTNEPVIVTVIVRNLSEQGNYVEFKSSRAECLHVIAPGGIDLERTDAPKPKTKQEAALLKISVVSDELPLIPKMQRKVQFDLREHFDLSRPGSYTVYATPMVIDHAIQGFKDIRSGNAVIIITNLPATETNPSSPKPKN